MRYVVLFRTFTSSWKCVLFLAFSVWLHQHFSIDCCLNIRCLKIWHLKSPFYIKWQLFTNPVRLNQQAKYTKLGSIGGRWENSLVFRNKICLMTYILQLPVQFWMVLEDGAWVIRYVKPLTFRRHFCSKIWVKTMDIKMEAAQMNVSIVIKVLLAT